MQLCTGSENLSGFLRQPVQHGLKLFRMDFFEMSDFMQNRTDFSHRAQMQVDGRGLTALIPHFLLVCQKLEGVEGFKIL